MIFSFQLHLGLSLFPCFLGRNATAEWPPPTGLNSLNPVHAKNENDSAQTWNTSRARLHSHWGYCPLTRWWALLWQESAGIHSLEIILTFQKHAALVPNVVRILFIFKFSCFAFWKQIWTREKCGKFLTFLSSLQRAIMDDGFGLDKTFSATAGEMQSPMLFHYSRADCRLRCIQQRAS